MNLSFSYNQSKFLEPQIQNKNINPLKSTIDAFLELQPPKHKKVVENIVDFLTFFSEKIYNLQENLRPFCQQLRDTVDFKWTPQLQQKFNRVKKELTDGTLRLAIPNSEKRFYFLCDASNYGIGAALVQKSRFGNKEVVSANSCLFSIKELRFSTILFKCYAIISALSEYELLIQGSQNSIILYTDQKPIPLLFTQKNKPNHRVSIFNLS